MTEPSASAASSSSPAFAVRGLHLDLKGLPPTPARLLSLLPLIARSGYNALLVEWEDMFPWTVDERFRCETAYTPAQVKAFHAAAAEHGLDVIPLVQCLGHMETALTPPGREHLREQPGESHTLNPLAPGARELVQQMVDDVLTLMPRPRYFHLGGDEAWTFGSHPDTKAYVEKHGKGALYLHHIEPVLDHLNAQGIRPILWHDMMRDWTPTELRRLGAKADLMPWGYKGHPDTVQQHWNSKIIERFHAEQMPLWGAGCYKGADGDDIDVPHLERRWENAEAWVEVGTRYGFKGLVATAWSRYATHRSQCEPIDGSLDALVSVGRIMHDGKRSATAREDALALLDELGEREHFERCRVALDRLQAMRDRCWRFVRVLRQQIVVATQDVRRRHGGALALQLRQWSDAMHDLAQVADEVRASLAGRIDALWLDRYMNERMIPLQDEFDMILARVQELDGDAWRAAQRRPAVRH